ncbi:hypothetical protein I4U23_011755 [Adineta vaga]|nr:hypothetical protein I4U23_011755 [Adineta vaga]
MSTKETSLERCIKDLSAKNTDYKYPEQAINQAESLKSLSSDLYTDNIRFIYELIQNADDAQAKHIVLATLSGKYLVIAHNGKTFDEKDLQGLCGINNGTKKKDLNKTGYKGLGFKAVFGKSDHVLIYSNGEYFRFDASYRIQWIQQWGTIDQQTWEKENDRQFIYPWQINPVWTTENEIPHLIQTFINSRKKLMNVAYIIQLTNIEEIYSAIDQLKQQPYMFLFLRNISELTFQTQSVNIISIARHSSHGLKHVSINKQIDSQWIIKRIELDVPDDVRKKLIVDSKAPEKLQSIKRAEMFLAAKYADMNNGGIEKLSDQDSILFSYLPTKIFEYKFPVLINANFLTNVNREQIHTDSIWNQWLFEKIGCEIFQWITELVKDPKFRYQAYRLIPSYLTSMNNLLSKRFNESFTTTITNCRFILNRKNKLLKINEAMMDLTTLSNQSSFIDVNSMRQYIINNTRDSYYADYPFIDYDPNLAQIGVQQFTWEQCIDMFKSNIFLKTHSPEQNRRMIEYFYLKFSKSNSNNKDIHIEQIPFLMDQNYNLQLIKNIYFPAEIIDNNATSDSDDLFVNKIIFDWLNEKTQRVIKQWLQTLGVIERTDLSFLSKTIIPNASTYATLENTFKTIRMLFLLFQKHDIDKKELNQLKKLKLLTTGGNFLAADQCFFCDQYKPRSPLEDYLKTKEDRFLSFDYVINSNIKKGNDDLAEWRRFFIMMGVQEELHPIVFNRKLTLYEAKEYGFHDNYLLIRSPDEKHTVDAYSGLSTIAFIRHTENNHDFAKFFWSYVITNISVETLAQNIRIYWGHAGRKGATEGTQLDDDYYVSWFVKNIKCIPTTNETCELASHIFADVKELRELCGKYMIFSVITFPKDRTTWNHIFDFKTKLSSSDYFELLRQIHKDEKNIHENIDRIQMIYHHILKEIYFWSSEEQNTIKRKAKSLYLLSENGQWELACDLYVYMEGNVLNNNLNDAIPCLKLDFKHRNHLHLKQFLDLLGVKQIRMNDFKLADKQSSPAEHFRQKLIEISPFLKKWLKYLSFQSKIILEIDEKIQQDNDFIESDSLELFYHQKLVQKTNVYYDFKHKQLYIRRPCDSETTLIELPYKLCQLLNINGFEKHIRFLLKATIEEIKAHFIANSISVPTKKDIVILELSSKSESKSSTTPTTSTPLPNASNLPAAIPEPSKSDSTLTKTESSIEQQSKPTKTTDRQHQMTNTTIGKQSSYQYVPPYCPEPIYGLQQVPYPFAENCEMSSASVFIETRNAHVDDIELIDVSSITPSDVIFFENQSNGNEVLNTLDLITGRMGEEMVYKYLLDKYSHHRNSVCIKWENGHGETFKPHDILLIQNGITYFIEVKSTRTYNQHLFPLSISQIEAFSKYKENYFIYRVYVDERKFIILDNIRWRLMEKQHLSCFLKITPALPNETISS